MVNGLFGDHGLWSGVMVFSCWIVFFGLAYLYLSFSFSRLSPLVLVLAS